jgi:hypothetical protein
LAEFTSSIFIPSISISLFFTLVCTLECLIYFVLFWLVCQYRNTFNWLFRIAHFEYYCTVVICCSVSALQILITFLILLPWGFTPWSPVIGGLTCGIQKYCWNSVLDKNTNICTLNNGLLLYCHLHYANSGLQYYFKECWWNICVSPDIAHKLLLKGSSCLCYNGKCECQTVHLLCHCWS